MCLRSAATTATAAILSEHLNIVPKHNSCQALSIAEGRERVTECIALNVYDFLGLFLTFLNGMFAFAWRAEIGYTTTSSGCLLPT